MHLSYFHFFHSSKLTTENYPEIDITITGVVFKLSFFNISVRRFRKKNELNIYGLILKIAKSIEIYRFEFSQKSAS